MKNEREADSAGRLADEVAAVTAAMTPERARQSALALAGSASHGRWSHSGAAQYILYGESLF